MTFIQLQPTPPNDLFQDRLRLFQVQQSLEQQAINKQALLRDEQSRAAFGTALTAYQNNDKDALAKSFSSMTPDHAKNLFDVFQNIEAAKQNQEATNALRQKTDQANTEFNLKIGYNALKDGGFNSRAENSQSNTFVGPLSDLENARINYKDFLETAAQQGVVFKDAPTPETATMNQIMNFERILRGAQGTVNPLQNISGETQALILARGGDPYNIETYKNPYYRSLLEKDIKLNQRLTQSKIAQNYASANAATLSAQADMLRAAGAAKAEQGGISLTPSTAMDLSRWGNLNYLHDSLSVKDPTKVITTASADKLNKKAMGISMLGTQFASVISLLDETPYSDLVNPYSTKRALLDSATGQVLTTVKEMEELGALDRGVVEQFNNMFGRLGFTTAHNFKKVAITFMKTFARKQTSSFEGTGLRYKTNYNNMHKQFVEDFASKNGRVPTKQEVDRYERSLKAVFQ